MDAALNEGSSTGSRLLALDVGTRRIGLAISGRVAAELIEPLFTMERKGDRQDVKSLVRLLRKHEITGVVVGHPLRLCGEKSAQTLRVERLAETLRSAIAVPVFLHDERLSTVAAQEHLQLLGEAARGDRGIIDQVAAMIILESFLLHRAHLEAMALVRAGDVETGQAAKLP